jgi:hypothetical protein
LCFCGWFGVFGGGFGFLGGVFVFFFFCFFFWLCVWVVFGGGFCIFDPWCCMVGVGGGLVGWGGGGRWVWEVVVVGCEGEAEVVGWYGWGVVSSFAALGCGDGGSSGSGVCSDGSCSSAGDISGDRDESRLSLGVAMMSARMSSPSDVSSSAPSPLFSAAANSARSLSRSDSWSRTSRLRTRSAWASCRRAWILTARASCSSLVRRDRA